MLLNYDAADLTLEGALLAGLIAGPYTGAHRRRLFMWLPALAAGEYGALFFAVGCGFAGGGIARGVPQGRHLETSRRLCSSACPATCGGWCATCRSTGRSCCCCAPIGLEFDPADDRRALSATRGCSTCRARRLA